ncbi:unnamed protein product [Acanthoscelides obtectus]|uniref:Uncharacterized protein n=1 Tax=Acanthoscelides obtectus TaxID=200917 RepID=A0A9P0QBJ2_ACAOB|nr:unnamed protein product [Acanthoscelides obtectus]CAK1682795.1 hypothetical protein AOBTE_LOCUS33889 [Acanthoscelides obtectus]
MDAQEEHSTKRRNRRRSREEDGRHRFQCRHQTEEAGASFLLRRENPGSQRCQLPPRRVLEHQDPAPMAGTGVPPINIEGTADWSSLSRMMNSKGIQFSKARTAGTSVKVFTNTPADYRQLVALLESIKRPFFTYQLKEDRMDQRVIRGLREMSVNDIKEDLVSQGIADAGSAADLKDHKEATSALPRQDEDAGKACRDPEAGHAHDMDAKKLNHQCNQVVDKRWLSRLELEPIRRGVRNYIREIVLENAQTHSDDQ